MKTALFFNSNEEALFEEARKFWNTEPIDHVVITESFYYLEKDEHRLLIHYYPTKAVA